MPLASARGMTSLYFRLSPTFSPSVMTMRILEASCLAPLWALNSSSLQERGGSRGAWAEPLRLGGNEEVTSSGGLMRAAQSHPRPPW